MGRQICQIPIANNSNHKLFYYTLLEVRKQPLAQTPIYILLFKFQSTLSAFVLTRFYWVCIIHSLFQFVLFIVCCLYIFILPRVRVPSTNRYTLDIFIVFVQENSQTHRITVHSHTHRVYSHSQISLRTVFIGWPLQFSYVQSRFIYSLYSLHTKSRLSLHHFGWKVYFTNTLYVDETVQCRRSFPSTTSLYDFTILPPHSKDE